MLLMSVTGERRGDADGRRNPKAKTHYHEGANDTQAWWTGWVKRRPTGSVGSARGELGQLGRSQERIQMEI
jgi:hypothetical protein